MVGKLDDKMTSSLKDVETASKTLKPSRPPLRGGHPSDTATVIGLEGQANQSEGPNVGENPQRP